MNTLEAKITDFDNWTQPWTFYEFVANNKELTENELAIFNEIWAKANVAELWSNDDIVVCCEATQAFINANYGLSDKAIAQIVRAITYEWR